MGVTIHYRFGQLKKDVQPMLDEVQQYAVVLKEQQAEQVGVPFNIERVHPYRLHIDIGGCETLSLGFGGIEHWAKKTKEEGYSYEGNTLSDCFTKEYLSDPELMFCSAFCKTQYAEKLIEHKWVADILAKVASRCRLVCVSDEGDYYHSGNIQEAAEAIGANGEMIAEMTGMLQKNFGAENVAVGGVTKVKPRK